MNLEVTLPSYSRRARGGSGGSGGSSQKASPSSAEALSAQTHPDAAPSLQGQFGNAFMVQQLQAKGASSGGAAGARAIAAEGVSGSGGRLPHLQTIQSAFGRHDVSGIGAHVGGAAGDAARAMGAEAYATGDRVAFDGAPDLHTAAHEAAHVVQQASGVSLRGGVGESGDAYERHADAVADAVVRGRSAEPLLDAHAAPSGGSASFGAVQRVDTDKADERIGYDDVTYNESYMRVDPEAAAGADQQTLPWCMFLTGWDPDTILERWTQVDASVVTFTDSDRCSIMASMAPRIIAGPGAILRFAQQIKGMEAQIRAHCAQMGFGDGGPIIAGLDAAIANLSQPHQRGNPGTYEDLNWIAEAGMLAMTDRFSDGADTGEARAAFELGEDPAMTGSRDAEGGSRSIDRSGNNSATVLRSRQDVLSFLSVLEVGESFLLTVDLYARSSSYNGKPADTNHYITVGRQMAADEADEPLYLYDSEPKTGSQLQYLPEKPTDEAFWAYFECAPKSVPGAEANFKGAGVVSAVAPEVDDRQFANYS